jgi:hypothetical protein
MKKEYMKPAMKVYEFEQKPQLLVGSGGGGEMNYIPTLPGQPTDDKHLA